MVEFSLSKLIFIVLLVVWVMYLFMEDCLFLELVVFGGWLFLFLVFVVVGDVIFFGCLDSELSLLLFWENVDFVFLFVYIKFWCIDLFLEDNGGFVGFLENCGKFCDIELDLELGLVVIICCGV